MALIRKREKHSVDRRQSLAGVPVLHKNVRIHDGGADVVSLRMQVHRGRSFFDRFRPPVMEKTYELDEFGTFVVRQIDSRKTVLDIIRAFERKYRMTHREAELGVVAFIKILMKRNVLSVAASGTGGRR